MPIGGVVLEPCGRDLRGLAIGGGGHQQADELLQVPVVGGQLEPEYGRFRPSAT